MATDPAPAASARAAKEKPLPPDPMMSTEPPAMLHFPYPREAVCWDRAVNAPVNFSAGEAWGLPVVKFTLTFRGSLPASANKPKNREKWEIRKQFDPQLRELWRVHPALIAIEQNRHFPERGGTLLRQTHHQYPGPIIIPESQRVHPDSGVIDMCEDINKFGRCFRPLVRESYALHCGLNIRFLRNEPPGRVYQGGDLDGRIKTLIDALAMPQHAEQIIKDGEGATIFCLMEDDATVSGVQVESERLLAHNNQGASYVEALIEIDVRVRQATIYNQSFLGG